MGDRVLKLLWFLAYFVAASLPSAALAIAGELGKQYVAERFKAYSQYKELLRANPSIGAAEKARRTKEIFAKSDESFRKLQANVISSKIAAVMKGAYSSGKNGDKKDSLDERSDVQASGRPGAKSESGQSASGRQRSTASTPNRIGTASGGAEVETAGAKRVSFKKTRGIAAEADDSSAGAKPVSFSSPSGAGSVSPFSRDDGEQE